MTFSVTISHAARLTLLLLGWTWAAWAAPPVIALDVGHDLVDGGAISARNQPEFPFNRVLAGKLAAALQARQLAVREINFDGDVMDLAARPALAAGSDLFISIHHDAIGEEHLLPWTWDGRPASHTEAKRGFGLFVSSENPDPATSLQCASRLGQALRRAGFTATDWHGRKHRAADAENGVWFYDTLLVLRRTTLPAVLLEAGVIKHREEELELLDPARQERMAATLASGIAECLPAGQTSVRPGLRPGQD